MPEKLFSGPFTLAEIADLAELPKRTIRFYIKRGLVDPPEGASRGAYYVKRHIDQIVLVRKWQTAGLSLEKIGELMKEQKLPVGSIQIWNRLIAKNGVRVDIKAILKNPKQRADLIKAASAFICQIERINRP